MRAAIDESECVRQVSVCRIGPQLTGPGAHNPCPQLPEVASPDLSGVDVMTAPAVPEVTTPGQFLGR